MQVEGTLRYAMSSDISPPSPPHDKSPSTPLLVQCLHIKDVLLDMLEDIQDNVDRIGSCQLHERGAKVRVDAKDVSDAVGLLNQAISVKLHDGVHQMNSLFEDAFANSFNSSNIS